VVTIPEPSIDNQWLVSRARIGRSRSLFIRDAENYLCDFQCNSKATDCPPPNQRFVLVTLGHIPQWVRKVGNITHTKEPRTVRYGSGSGNFGEKSRPYLRVGVSLVS
jgi:hypothetical protein